MKITLFELLKMIKEGNKPKRFIWRNILWYLEKSDTEHYYANNNERQFVYIELEWLDEEIEILEGDK